MRCRNPCVAPWRGFAGTTTRRDATGDWSEDLGPRAPPADTFSATAQGRRMSTLNEMFARGQPKCGNSGGTDVTRAWPGAACDPRLHGCGSPPPVVRARTCGTYSRKPVNFGAIFNPSCSGEPGRGGNDRRATQRYRDQVLAYGGEQAAPARARRPQASARERLEASAAGQSWRKCWAHWDQTTKAQCCWERGKRTATNWGHP